MKIRTVIPLGVALLFGAGPATVRADIDAVTECTALEKTGVEDVTITAVTAEQPGAAWARGERGVRTPLAVTRGFCRVQGRIEERIAFELWLPRKQDWNGKFLGAGVGGAAGTFNFNDLPRGINRGYAAATTDTGHKIDDPAWMLDAVARDNYTHRANHLLAVKAKEIVNRFYGQAPSHSYFVGCSGGGRQGLKELQKYPEDYDGILSGANGPRTPEMTVRRMWEILQRDSRPGLMKPADWQLIADAGTRACDHLDGVKDGVVGDPRSCTFKVKQLSCRKGQTSNCLSPEQVEFASRFYAPLRKASGEKIDSGILPGVLIDSGRSQLAPATFGQAVRGLKEWDGKDFDVGRDLDGIDRVMPELRADATDLSRFARDGRKVIFYTGWLDGAVSARMIMEYQDAMSARMGGAARAAEFSRLYMIPGMYHCAGGPGADQVGGAGADAPQVDAKHDLLSALEAWVEQGKPPAAMIASKLEGKQVSRTSLICPYPQQARYRSGDPMDAASFACGAPR